MTTTVSHRGEGRDEEGACGIRKIESHLNRWGQGDVGYFIEIRNMGNVEKRSAEILAMHHSFRAAPLKTPEPICRKWILDYSTCSNNQGRPPNAGWERPGSCPYEEEGGGVQFLIS